MDKARPTHGCELDPGAVRYLEAPIAWKQIGISRSRVTWWVKQCRATEYPPYLDKSFVKRLVKGEGKCNVGEKKKEKENETKEEAWSCHVIPMAPAVWDSRACDLHPDLTRMNLCYSHSHSHSHSLIKVILWFTSFRWFLFIVKWNIFLVIKGRQLG